MGVEGRSGVSSSPVNRVLEQFANIQIDRNLPMKGRFGQYEICFNTYCLQEGIDTKDHHGHDIRQGCVVSLPRCAEKHSHI